MYTIYAHINKKNKKKYIGLTKQKLSSRWANGAGYKECPRFYNAICRYGWNNFNHIIIETGIKTKEEAEEKEKFYIQKYKTTDENFGYNLSIGGGVPSNVGHPHTEETKRKIGEAHKEWWANMSEEERAQAKEKSIKNLENVTHVKGKKHPLSKPVYCIDLQLSFDCIADAAEYIHPSNIKSAVVLIGNCCRKPNRYKQAYGHQWQYLLPAKE